MRLLLVVLLPFYISPSVSLSLICFSVSHLFERVVRLLTMTNTATEMMNYYATGYLSVNNFGKRLNLIGVTAIILAWTTLTAYLMLPSTTHLWKHRKSRKHALDDTDLEPITYRRRGSNTTNANCFAIETHVSHSVEEHTSRNTYTYQTRQRAARTTQRHNNLLPPLSISLVHTHKHVFIPTVKVSALNFAWLAYYWGTSKLDRFQSIVSRPLKSLGSSLPFAVTVY